MSKDKKDALKPNDTADVALMGIDKRVAALTNRYRKVDDVDLNAISDKLTNRVKDLSDQGIILQYLAGRAISADAFKKIEGDVDPDSVVKFSRPVPTYRDEDKTELLPVAEWEIREYVRNGHVNQLQRAAKMETLNEAQDMNLRLHEAKVGSDLDDINSRRGAYSAERKAVSSEKNARTAAKIHETMVKKGIKTQTLRKLFESKFGKVVVKEVITA